MVAVEPEDLSGMNHENDLTLRYLPLAAAMAREVKSLPLEDAVQEAAIGLMTGARKFDPERGASFATYARYWIAEALQRAAIRALPVHVPLQKAKDSHARYKKSNPYAQSDNPMAREASSTQVFSVPIEREDGTPIYELPSQDDIEAIDQKMDAMRIFDMLESLPYRQRKAIAIYYLEDGATLESIGAEMGISREAVRQCIQRGIASLRQQLGIDVEETACR
jgi:RNA polymerase sigma factor (sigma-70 family)